MNYEQARRDHEYLWKTYGPAYDMTGAYTDSEDLEKMLENPTNSMATKCYVRQIEYWFQAGFGGEELGYFGDAEHDSIVTDIADRHWCDFT